MQLTGRYMLPIKVIFSQDWFFFSFEWIQDWFLLSITLDDVSSVDFIWWSSDDPHFVQVCLKDLECLAPQEFLNSPVMNFYIRCRLYCTCNHFPLNKCITSLCKKKLMFALSLFLWVGSCRSSRYLTIVTSLTPISTRSSVTLLQTRWSMVV